MNNEHNESWSEVAEASARLFAAEAREESLIAEIVRLKELLAVERAVSVAREERAEG